ncbi:MAG: hypothetical protein KDF65_15270, partial [Anaerolineae bacterium]|nr:hypothetical protein [Anaerolineae bacterium]
FSGGEFSGQARPDAIEAGSFGQWAVYLFQTYWGVPVLEHDPLFPWAYLLLALLCLLALVGLWQLWRAADSPTRMLLATLLFIVALLLPFPILRFLLTRNILETGQGRHILYPAAQAIPLLLVWGWSWAGSQGRRGARKREGETTSTSYVSRFTFHASRHLPYGFTFLIPLLLLTWSIFQFVYMKDTYPAPLPVQTTTFDPAAIPQPVIPQKFGDSIEFLGYDFQPDAAQAIINLTLYWQALAPVEENYRVRVQLRDEADQPHFTWLSHPLNGKYPTRAWDKGDVIRDELALPLAAVPAGSYTLYLNLLHEAEDVPLLDEPYWLIQIPLGQRQPIPNPASLADFTYRLWLDETVPARHRQVLPLSWLFKNETSDSNPKWTLLGPDNLPRPPAASADNTVVFMVGADWPSGEYRLQVETATGSSQTEPLLTVANEARLFELPPLPDTYVPVEANFAGQVQLRGYSLPTRRVEPGGGLPLTLYWQGQAPVMADLVTFAVLLDADQQPHGQVDRYPLGFYSPLLWAEGEVVVDAFSLPLPAAAPPGVYTVHLGQYRLVDEQPVSQPLLQDGQPSQTTAVVIGPIKVGGPPADVTVTDPQPEYRLNQAFGEQVTLLGYDLTDQTGQPLPSSGEGEAAPLVSGERLHLTLYWRAEANPALDLTTFGHLRNAANETVAQKDSPPAGGRYPTSLWAAGEIIVDELTLPLTALPPGRYTPVVGLYDPASGNRLLTPGLPANEVALKSISVGQE